MAEIDSATEFLSTIRVNFLAFTGVNLYRILRYMKFLTRAVAGRTRGFFGEIKILEEVTNRLGGQ